MTQASAGGWMDQFSFCAWDVPVAGTARYSVLQSSSVPVLPSVPEQYKISASAMVQGLWMWRADFYAMPAARVFLS
jgi:hypothetical protein